MKPSISSHSPTWLLLIALALTLTLCTACGQTELPTAPPSTPIVPTATPTGIPPNPTREPTSGLATIIPTETPRPTTSVEAARAAFDTAVAQHDADLRNKYALTPPPPIPTLGPPQPSPTWIMGMQGCVNGISYAPLMLGCWRGALNGEFISVAGGRQTEGDRTQGLLLVFHGPLFDPLATTTEVYSTPVKLGAVRLVSVDGTLCTLIPYDPLGSQGTPTPLISPTPAVVFIFDLRTRQWVITPTPTYPPMQSPTPVATVTLTRPDMDATKVARYDQQREEWAAMATRIANGTPFVYTPIPIPTTPPRPPPVLGLYAGCIDPDPYYTYRSCWVGLQNNEYLFVSAGSIKTDPIQGMVRVYTTTLDQQTWGPEQTYFTPAKAGLVRITGAVDQRLTLRTDSGTLFYFDLVTRQWATPTSSPVPSLLPTP